MTHLPYLSGSCRSMDILRGLKVTSPYWNWRFSTTSPYWSGNRYWIFIITSPCRGIVDTIQSLPLPCNTHGFTPTGICPGGTITTIPRKNRGLCWRIHDGHITCIIPGFLLAGTTYRGISTLTGRSVLPFYFSILVLVILPHLPKMETRQLGETNGSNKFLCKVLISLLPCSRCTLYTGISLCNIYLTR